MMLIVLLSVCLSICWAQGPQPCQAPKQFVCTRVKIDRSKEFTEIERYLYDETNKRTRSTQDIRAGTERDYYDIIRLYTDMKEYKLNLRTKQCNVSTIDTPFRTKGVPADAKFLFEGLHGAAGIPNEYLVAMTFGGNTTDGARYFVSVTSPDCVPLIFDIESKSGTEHYTDRFFNLTITTPNPADFVPFPQCTKQSH